MIYGKQTQKFMAILWNEYTQVYERMADDIITAYWWHLGASGGSSIEHGPELAKIVADRS